MTIEEALRAFSAARARVISDLRKPFIETLSALEADLRRQRPFPKPSGPLRLLFRGDYQRLRADIIQRVERAQQARASLAEFEAAVASPNDHFQKHIALGTRKICEEVDTRILATIRADRQQKAEARQTEAAVMNLSRETGTQYTFLGPALYQATQKHAATLVGSINIDGRKLAQTTRDRGYSFELYAWLPEMEAYVGRPCWFWYDGRGCPRFMPLVGSRAPVSPSGSAQEGTFSSD
jgi:hypothetical protein